MVAPLFCNYGMALTERNLERERERVNAANSKGAICLA